MIVPVTEFRDVFGIALTNMINGADPATELKKATERVPAGARQEREGVRRPRMRTRRAPPSSAERAPARRRDRCPVAVTCAVGLLRAPPAQPSLFVVPALVVVGAVIVFPWLFTVWMSAFDWTIGTAAHFVGLEQLHEAR